MKHIHRLWIPIIALFAALSATPVVRAQMYVVPRAIVVANLYAGPGESYPVVGTVVPGMPVPIVQVSLDGQWYRSSNGSVGPWIAASAIDNPPRLETLWPLTPISQLDPTATPTPVATSTPTPDPDLAEIYTVGEWARASYERKQVNVAVWTIAFSQQGNGDLTAFGYQLLTCIDAKVHESLQALGDNYPLVEVATACVFALSPAATATPVPVVEVPTATPIPAVEVPTVTPTAVIEVVQPPAAAPCDCSGDTLNCSDFERQPEAQACYQYCVATVGYDIHGLDGNDNDGAACESLPN